MDSNHETELTERLDVNYYDVKIASFHNFIINICSERRTEAVEKVVRAKFVV